MFWQTVFMYWRFEKKREFLLRAMVVAWLGAFVMGIVKLVIWLGQFSPVR